MEQQLVDMNECENRVKNKSLVYLERKSEHDGVWMCCARPNRAANPHMNVERHPIQSHIRRSKATVVSGAKWMYMKPIEIDRSNRCLFMNEDLIYCAPLWLRKRFAVTVPKFAARKWNGRNLEMVRHQPPKEENISAAPVYFSLLLLLEVNTRCDPSVCVCV